MIPESLRPLAWPITDLKPDPQNARLHNERNLNAIKASLQKFGQQKPIVALPDGTVIAGNGTLEAAKAIGWPEIAVTVFKGSAIEAKAYALADNRTAELAEWDYEQLSKDLEWLEQTEIQIDDFGFSDDDFSKDLDYSGLENSDLEQELEEKSNGVRKAIQIEFETKDYDRAFTIVKQAREKGVYVGMVLIESLEQK